MPRRTFTIRTTVRRTVRVTGTVRTRYTVTPQYLPSPLRTVSTPMTTTTRIIRSPDGGAGPEMLHVEPPSPERWWDVFICHATEDKDSIVRNLAAELAQLGIKPWYDEMELQIGDSLLQRVDHGLSHSRFGIVVLSHSFFAKSWPKRELDGLVALESQGRQKILPVWHGLSSEDVAGYSPTLAGLVAARTSEASAAAIAQRIADLIESAG